jgi:hypothetical protein
MARGQRASTLVRSIGIVRNDNLVRIPITTTVPILNGPSADLVTTTGFRVQGGTDVPSTMELRYGTASNFVGAVTVTMDTSNGLSFSKTLSGLIPATRYYFDIQATRSSNGAVSARSSTSVTTLAQTGGGTSFQDSGNFSGVTVAIGDKGGTFVMGDMEALISEDNGSHIDSIALTYRTFDIGSGAGATWDAPDPWICRPNDSYRITAANAVGTHTYRITYNGQQTPPINVNASAATVQAAIQALSTVGSGNATVSGAISLNSTTGLYNGSITIIPAGTLFETRFGTFSLDISAITSGTLVGLLTQQQWAIYGSMLFLDSGTQHEGLLDVERDGLHIYRAFTFTTKADNIPAASTLVADRFIDPVNGDDTYDGTSATFTSGTTGPWKTISRAIALAINGMTIQIAPGWLLRYNGTVTKSLTFKAQHPAVNDVGEQINTGDWTVFYQGGLSGPTGSSGYMLKAIAPWEDVSTTYGQPAGTIYRWTFGTNPTTGAVGHGLTTIQSIAANDSLITSSWKSLGRWKVDSADLATVAGWAALMTTNQVHNYGFYQQSGTN